jgi:autotransporter-associated beta strand protein
VTFSVATNASGLSQIRVANNGLLGITTNVSASDMSNVTALQRGGIRATGANGSFSQLGSNVLNYVGAGGALVLDNNSSLNTNRLSDTANLAVNDYRFVIVGRNSNNSTTNEVVGNLTFSKSAIINLDESNTNNSAVDLTVQNLTFSPTVGNTLLIITDVGDFGLGASNSTIVVDGATKPSVTNGMISPQIQQYDGANNTGHFVSFSGNSLISANGSYTDYAGSWAAATSNQIVNVTAAANLGSGGNLSVYALRVQAGNQDLGGRTISIGSGGVISNNVSLSNGTISFGSSPGFYGAYNPSAQITISAIIAGANGLTIMGSSQSVDLNSANTFTGGLFINGGVVTLGNATAANGNDVTVNAFGALQTDFGTVTGAVIGGLSGSGLVASDHQSTGNRYLAIAPSNGTHTFEGRLTNGATGKVLNLLKNGSGTQVFGANSVATFTGTTSVNAGTLQVDGNFSAATGAVSVASGATLTGSGSLGGATTLNSGAILAPGNSSGPGVLSFGNSLLLTTGSDIRMEINGSTRGTAYDAINVTGALTYDGNLQLTFGQSFGTGVHNFSLLTFGSQSGSFDSITLAGSYTGSLANNSGTWTLTNNLDSFEFSQATGSLTLTVSVPEPGTWALLALAVGPLLLTLARRKKTSNA